MVGRLLAGARKGSMSNADPSLIAEVAYPHHQGVATAMYMTGYYYGSVVATWVTFGTSTLDSNWAWRIPSLLQLLMPLLALTGFWFIPESPGWLVSVGRVEEAHQTLATIHADNDPGAPWMEEELRMIHSSTVTG